MDALRRDLRYTVRTLAKAPGFLLAAVFTLALAIALNVAVFSVVNALVLRPLPVASPDELVAVYSAAPDEFMSHAPLTTSDYEHLRDGTRSFAELIATTYRPVALEHGAEGRLALGEWVTPGYFTFLGVRPFLGRMFEAGDGDAVAVLSHTAFERRHGSDPGIVGRTLRVNGRPVTVVGVAPEGFSGLTHGISPELWQPMELGSSSVDRDLGWLWVTGRLAPGRTADEARAEVGLVAERLRRELPTSYEGREFAVIPKSRVRILPGVDGTLFAASSLALGGVALVLLIAAANVANMLLARAAGRRREIATRLSLGAGPVAVSRQLLTESFVLSALAGGLGLAAAAGIGAALESLRVPIPVDLVFGSALDPRVIAFTLALSTLTACIFGLAPAVDAARTDLAGTLRGASNAVSGRRRRWGRDALAVVQIALSLLLLICAGLFARSLVNAFRIDPGFDADGVVVASFAPGLRGSRPGAPRREELYGRLLDRVRALPGVESAGLASHLPLSVEYAFERVAAAGEGSAPAAEWPRIDVASVDPGYFETLGIPLVRGRTFDGRDTEAAAYVAVVNEAFARRFWPRREAVGRELRVDGLDRVYRVAGVVGDGKYRTLGEAPRPFLYLTFAQGRWRRQGHGGEITSGTETLVARVTGDPGAALAAIRRAAREIDDQVAVSRLGTLEEALAPALAPTRLAAGLFAVLGLAGLMLAATGVYAVVAYATSRRTREIGIRMALGARRRDVLSLVVRDGLSVTALGVALGWAAAALAARVLAAFLYGVAGTDALTWTAVSSLLAAVALLASALPARRAAAVEPLVALRHE